MNCKKIEDCIKNEIKANHISGASLVIYKNNKIVLDKNFGFANIEKKIKISDKTRFRLASMTKPITAVAAMVAEELGLLNIDDYAYKYIKEIKDLSLKDENFKQLNNEKYNFTIRQLLSHSAGFAANERESKAFYLIKDDDLHDLKDCIKYVKDIGVQFEPGTKMAYSGSLAYNIVARIIEIVSGLKFYDFLKKYIFNPLEMNDTSYVFNTNDEKAISYKFENNNLIFVDDLNRGFECYYPGYNSGGAGLISTKNNYLKFALMLLKKGEYNGIRIISEKSFNKLMEYTPTPNAVSGSMETFGLSFFVRDKKYSNWQSLPSGSFGWSGAYGTHFWVDPTNKMVVVYMHNSSTFGGAGCSQHLKLESNIIETFNLRR